MSEGAGGGPTHSQEAQEGSPRASRGRPFQDPTCATRSLEASCPTQQCPTSPILPPFYCPQPTPRRRPTSAHTRVGAAPCCSCSRVSCSAHGSNCSSCRRARAPSSAALPLSLVQCCVPRQHCHTAHQLSPAPTTTHWLELLLPGLQHHVDVRTMGARLFRIPLEQEPASFPWNKPASACAPQQTLTQPFPCSELCYAVVLATFNATNSPPATASRHLPP